MAVGLLVGELVGDAVGVGVAIENTSAWHTADVGVGIRVHTGSELA